MFNWLRIKLFAFFTKHRDNFYFGISTKYVVDFLPWVKDKSMASCTNDNCKVMWVFTFNELGYVSSTGLESWKNKVVNCPNCKKPVMFWHKRRWLYADGSQR